MTFESQTLGGLYLAQQRASDFLAEGNIRQKHLSLYEALSLQAASDLVRVEPSFSVSQINEMTPTITRETTVRILKGFAEIDLLDTTSPVIKLGPGRGRPERYHYEPTSLGDEVLGFFLTEVEKVQLESNPIPEAAPDILWLAGIVRTSEAILAGAQKSHESAMAKLKERVASELRHDARRGEMFGDWLKTLSDEQRAALRIE